MTPEIKFLLFLAALPMIALFGGLGFVLVSIILEDFWKDFWGKR